VKASLGCGSDPWGDVRVDIQRGSANILCDIQYLPFRNMVFDDVRSISVLEHVRSWRKGLREMLRVTKQRLILEVPINSDIRITDPWRILFPTPNNIKLFFSIPRRARETLWQMDPDVLREEIWEFGDYLSIKEKIFHVYAGVPSRCWRITAWRDIDEFAV
jgi:SAM-dependent methyltransferase